MLRRQLKQEREGSGEPGGQRPFSESMVRTDQQLQTSCCSRLLRSCCKPSSCSKQGSCLLGGCCSDSSEQQDGDKYAQELLMTEMDTLKRTIKEVKLVFLAVNADTCNCSFLLITFLRIAYTLRKND